MPAKVVRLLAPRTAFAPGIGGSGFSSRGLINADQLRTGRPISYSALFTVYFRVQRGEQIEEKVRKV